MRVLEASKHPHHQQGNNTEVYLVLKPGSQHWGLCIPHESEHRAYVGPISIRNVKERPKMTSTLAVTTISAIIEISDWSKHSEKD